MFCGERDPAGGGRGVPLRALVLACLAPACPWRQTAGAHPADHCRHFIPHLLLCLSSSQQLHVQSEAEHTALLAKLETLHLLQDSNRLLRDDADHKDAAITALRTEVGGQWLPFREEERWGWSSHGVSFFLRA